MPTGDSAASGRRTLGRVRAPEAWIGGRRIGMSEAVARSRGAVIRPEQAAEALTALDPIDGFHLSLAVDQPVAQALMIGRVASGFGVSRSRSRVARECGTRLLWHRRRHCDAGELRLCSGDAGDLPRMWDARKGFKQSGRRHRLRKAEGGGTGEGFRSAGGAVQMHGPRREHRHRRADVGGTSAVR